MNKQLLKLGILNIEGSDCDKFLQGQFTCDITTLSSDKATLCAHLNPKGRIISLFFIMRHEEGFYLLLPKELIPITLNSLKKYAVFYRATKVIDCTNDFIIYISKEIINSHKRYQLLSDYQLYLCKDADDRLDQVAMTEFTWQLSLIEQSIPTVYAQTSEKFLPHELNLHLLNAISLSKGCYTGQEIVARMHYKGKLKKVLLPYQHMSNQLPLPGADIFMNQEKVGMVVSSVQTHSNQFNSLLLLDNHDLIDKALTIEVTHS